MQKTTARDLMVPVEEYATVQDDASLYDAIKALKKAQKEFNRDGELYHHRAILVFDKDKKVIGKVSQLDVLKALEPKYRDMGDLGSVSRAGFSVEFIKSILDHYDLYQRPLGEMCMYASELKVKDVMYTPGSDEYVEESEVIGNAIHHLIMGHHQSLLVTRDDDIVGILRLTDIFNAICQKMGTEE